MKIIFFDTKPYHVEYFDKANNGRHEITYIKENISLDNVHLTKGFDAASGSVNSQVPAEVLKALASNGTKVWLQRTMGYNAIDLKAAEQFGVNVFRVPNYSAESVSEHAVTLLMALNRRLPQAMKRTKVWDFSLNGLQGKAIHGSTTGVIGSGKIGQGFIKAMVGMGSNTLVFDEYAQKNNPQLAETLGFKWASLNEVLSQSDFISLHAPLLPSTKHILNAEAFSKMKDGVIVVNASRGPLIDTTALIAALESGKVAAAGLDVIEREEGRFFEDVSSKATTLAKEDPEWAKLLSMDNVIVTGHQAFFTTLAISQIASITLNNADEAQKSNFEGALVILPDGKVKNG